MFEVKVTEQAPNGNVGDKARDLAASYGIGEFHACPQWHRAVCNGLGYRNYWLSIDDERGNGFLPLAHVKSRLFGSFLVSLPYVNTAGVIATNDEVAKCLIDRAIVLADELDVRYLELRHEQERTHDQLKEKLTSKVHMRLELPGDEELLWKQIGGKVRNQIRKGEKNDLKCRWGGDELLSDFYTVFSRNMRDLGTPVYGKRLFREIVAGFNGDAEYCLVDLPDGKPVAGGLLIHGATATEVPSASSLRLYNKTNANMFMYWQLLKRAQEKGRTVFDFGRSTDEGSNFRFKKQWGAQPTPAIWQYYVRKGSVGDMRPDNSKYDLMIRTWQKLPVWLTRWIGPPIVRGIP